MSDMTSSNVDEQPRKYLRKNNDISIGVTTRSRQREQDKLTDDSESMSTKDTLSEPCASVSIVEQCAICMENLIQQEIGIPENCEHKFCLACILEWAKKNNSCPIDRIAFRKIFKKHSIHSVKSYGNIEVEDNRLQVQLEDEFLEMIDDDLSCRVCGRTDREDVLLICDECGNGYHTFCLELPGVPDAPEWMCPLCEVDQMSADEALYDDSDLEEIQHILFDDSLNTTETDTERNDTPIAVRQPRVRQTARMRTSGTRNQRAIGTNTRTRRQTSRRRRRRRAPTRRPATLMQQQRERQRRQLVAQNTVHRRIDNINSISRDDSTVNVTSRQDATRLTIYESEPIALDEEPTQNVTSSSTTHRSIITPSEAARRIAASGIPVLSRSSTAPSISRELNVRRATPSLDRIPSRTIRPPSAQSRIPISQLPRIRRRVDAPVRTQSRPQRSNPHRPSPPPRTQSVPSTSTSFLDNLLTSQERLHNLQNVRMHGAHIQIF